jgi:hypothetical protein
MEKYSSVQHMENARITNHEELIQLDAERLSEEKEKELDEPQKLLDTKTLSEFFSSLEAATHILNDNDPEFEWSSACKQQVTEAV